MSTKALEQARELIAMAIAGNRDAAERVGAVALMPHQRQAVARARSAIRQFGGVLISDDVGTGKTYVALALAAASQCVCVCAPAALRHTWARAATRARMPITFVSIEALSRGRAPPEDTAFLIIDEAHHLRTPTTRRHRALRGCARMRPTVLLTATPVHNSPADRDALLALFLGDDAPDLSDEQRALVMVRTDAAPGGPPVRVHPPAAIPDAPAVVKCLVALPSPIPPRDGTAAIGLLRVALLRAWCSSEGALSQMARRAWLAASALTDAMHAGRHPTRDELRAWSTGDDGQLAFTELLTANPAASPAHAARAAACRDALQALRALLREHAGADDSRAAAVMSIAAAHPGVPLLACTQYAATVDALWARLRHVPGVCALTARGARIASGPISRQDALARFAPIAQGRAPPHDRERIRLLLTTDLVSEGLNLQDAGVLVHLDLPWTPARLVQRVGRVARRGSPHATVHVHSLSPPRAAAALLRLQRRLERKRAVAERTAGGAAQNASLLGSARTVPLSPADARAKIVALLAPFTPVRVDPAPPAEVGVTAIVPIASVHAPERGWIALVRSRGESRLVASIGRRAPTTDPLSVMRAVDWLCGGLPGHAPPAEVRRAQAALARWLGAERGSQLAGAARRHASRARAPALARAIGLVRSAPPHERARVAASQSAADASAPPGSPHAVLALVIFQFNDEDRSAL